MRAPPIQVATVDSFSRLPKTPGPKQPGCLDCVFTHLPPQARIDYCRLCEVEHSIRCHDVSVIEAASISRVCHHFEQHRPRRPVRHAGESFGSVHSNAVDVDTLDV